MFRLGMILLGGAMVLHARYTLPKKKTQDEEQADDSSNPTLPGGSKLYPDAPEPTLDPAVYNNPLLIGPPGGTGHQLPPAGGPTDPHGLPIPGAGIGGTINAGQLGAAGRAYNTIIGNAYKGIRQEVTNVERFVNFHRRLFKKLF